MSAAPLLDRAPQGRPEAPEWAEGMPAYWLRCLPAPTTAAEAAVLARFYRPPAAAPPRQAPGYDARLLARAGGERAAAAVVAFALRYFVSMGHRFTARQIKTVSERMVRAWELANRPGV